MRTWYNFKPNAGKTPVLSVLDDVGAYGVSAKDFLNDLSTVEGDSVDVEINSPGGDVFAGLAIYNGLRASGKTINVKVIGLAASAASIIAMAGDTIEMPENTFMMVHNPWSLAAGDAKELRASADVLEKIGDGLVTTYANRTGKGRDEITAMLDAGTWMTAQEAVDAGFATSVTAALALRASFDPARLPEGVRAVFNTAAQPEALGAPDAQVETPTPEPEIEALAPTHAEQVQEIAARAGMLAYSALWATDPALSDTAHVAARAAQARDVSALCALAKMPERADGFIRAATPLADVRAEIFNALAEADQHIDTSPPAKDTQNVGAQPTAVKGADIWAARRNKTKPGV